MLLLLASLTSCRKNNFHCYECDFDGTGYKQMGCYSTLDWITLIFNDAQGNPGDKSKCRINPNVLPE